MSDPINWGRLNIKKHSDTCKRVTSLIHLRTSTPSLHRNEVRFFGINDGFAATFDASDGEQVFVYCKLGGQPLGAAGLETPFDRFLEGQSKPATGWPKAYLNYLVN